MLTVYINAEDEKGRTHPDTMFRLVADIVAHTLEQGFSRPEINFEYPFFVVSVVEDNAAFSLRMTFDALNEEAGKRDLDRRAAERAERLKNAYPYKPSSTPHLSAAIAQAQLAFAALQVTPNGIVMANTLTSNTGGTP